MSSPRGLLEDLVAALQESREQAAPILWQPVDVAIHGVGENAPLRVARDRADDAEHVDRALRDPHRQLRIVGDALAWVDARGGPAAARFSGFHAREVREV